MQTPNLYTRWTKTGSGTVADILGQNIGIGYNETDHIVTAHLGTCTQPLEMDADTARMVGVRLIEAATRAEADTRLRIIE